MEYILNYYNEKIRVAGMPEFKDLDKYDRHRFVEAIAQGNKYEIEYTKWQILWKLGIETTPPQKEAKEKIVSNLMFVVLFAAALLIAGLLTFIIGK